MAKTFHIDFIKNRKIYFSISAALIILTVVLSFVLKVKVDIEFKGGAISTYRYSGTIDIEKAENLITEALGQQVNVQSSKDVVSNTQNLVVSLAQSQELSSDGQQKMTDTLKENFADNNITLLESVTVSPSTGGEFFAKCIMALVAASILLIVYVAFRFRKIGGWSAGIMSIIALIHDLIMVYAAFVVFQIPLNGNFMAVMLTILGYSLNDTIVIYDRVRENNQLYSGKLGIAECVNLSTNQCLTRSINTSVCTILALAVVCVVSLIYNIESIWSFAFPMVIGMISGVYSTLCIATPLWVTWQEFHQKRKKPTYAKKKKKA